MDYEQLERAMTGRGGDAPDPRRSAADALERIVSGERELRAVRHPLGFLCLPLLRDGDKGVCVHLFGTGARRDPAAAPMHAHSWELRSYVLYGRVGNIPVRVRDAPEAPTHRIFEVRSGPDGVDEIHPTARLVRGVPEPQHTTAGGQTYTMPAGHFHATAAGRDAPAATLVLGRTLPGRADLSLGPLHGGRHRTVRQLCDAGHTVRTARIALRRIHAEQRP